MYGWINDCVEKLVLEKFGLEAWESIKSAAGIDVPNGEWIRHHYYPDQITLDLVAAAAAALSVDAGVVLELFGTYFINFVKNAEYENLLKIQGNSLKEWLSSVNDLHRHLSISLPEIRPPEFWCLDDAENMGSSIILRYFSQRGGGLAPLVVGVVKEVAVLYFNMKIDMEIIDRQDVEGSRFTSWRIRVSDDVGSDPSQPRGRLTNLTSSTPELAASSAETKESSVTCPFTGKVYSTVAPPTSAADAPFRRNISIQSKQMAKLFPYHICVDRDFKVLQVGEKMRSMIDLAAGSPLYDYFEIRVPSSCPWDWSSILPSIDSVFELRMRETAERSVHMAFRGSVHTYDPESDGSVEEFYALFLMNPCVSSISELLGAGLNLSDIPLHTMQRDHILLGEHLISETKSAYKLDLLSKTLDKERKLSIALLEQMLPAKVAEDMRAGRPVPPEMFENATIFFSDIVGFTTIASSLEPLKVVDLLNTLYTVMDNVCTSFGLYKVETIGDAYMVVGGVPRADPDHATKVANFAICVSNAVSSVLSPLDQSPIQLRMGIHTGKVMAGVVGNLMPRYCLFGDTVNTASRMESNGQASRIHCSEAVATALNPTGLFILSQRGLVDIKGKGEMKTFWLEAATEENTAANSAAQAALYEESTRLLEKSAAVRPIYLHDKLVQFEAP